MGDFNKRTALDGSKVITRKGSKYEADIVDTANSMRSLAATDPSSVKSKVWNSKDSSESATAGYVSKRVSDAKAESDYDKKVGRSSKSYDDRENSDRATRSYSTKGSGKTIGQKDFPFLKHTVKGK